MVVDKIKEYLTPNTDKEIDEALLRECLNSIEHGIVRQLFKKTENKNTLRVSSIGKCLRQQAYTIHGYPKPELSYDTKLKFLMGDIIEALVVLLAKHSGVVLTDEQKEVDIDGVKGHIDGNVPDEEDNKYMFECKSMAARGFQLFQQVGMDDTFGYVSQANTYAGADDCDGIVWVGKNKNTSKLHEEVRKFDPKLYKKTQSNIKLLKKCKSPEDFDRKEWPTEELSWRGNPTGNTIIKPGAMCTYCPFFRTCFDDITTIKTGKSVVRHYLGPVIEGKWTDGGRVIND